MKIYLDNAAAMPPQKGTMERFAELSLLYFGNQESSGAAGVSAAKAVDSAKALLLEALLLPRDMAAAWTSGGSEGAFLAFELLKLLCPSGGKVLYSLFEHPCVLAAVKRLDSRFEKEEVKLLRNGTLDLEDLRSKLTPDTVLVAAGAVQSETGAVNDPRSIRSVISSAGSRALYFCDAVQAAGKLPLDLSKADILICSGQKLGCPASGVLIAPRGAGKFLRSLRRQGHIPGRLPPPSAILLAETLKRFNENMAENTAAVEDLNSEFRLELEKNIPGLFRFTVENASPYIVHILLKGFQGAIVTRALGVDGVSVAPGSACSSETGEPSAVLKAIGLSDEEAYSALRISFSPITPRFAIADFASMLKKVLAAY